MARKKGDITGSGANRRRWDGRRWVPAPVRSNSTSTRTNSTRTRTQNRRSSSSSTPVKPTPKKLADIPASSRPKDMQAGKVYGDAGQPPAPKLPPKPRQAPPKPTPTKPTKPTPRAASASNAQDLRRGRTPDTPSTSSTPPKKKYGVKDGNNAKGRSKRLTDALNNLKVRKY